MKKLILSLTLTVLAFGLQAADSKQPKETMPICTQPSSACCAKSGCAKSTPKIESPKGAEQSAK
jgi:hypothetical protein